MKDNIYNHMIVCIKNMDEKQMIELFHDVLSIGDIADIERIADCAYHFVENYEPPEFEEVTAPNEHFEHDCLQRGRDLADEQKRGY